MKYCPYCGAPILDGAVFCMSCGKSVPSIPTRNPSSMSVPQNNYDGYYDDVPAIDKQDTDIQENTSLSTIQKILPICIGAGLIIGACVLLMVVR